MNSESRASLEAEYFRWETPYTDFCTLRLILMFEMMLGYLKGIGFIVYPSAQQICNVSFLL